ncbi:MAG: class I SAM-dependent methyltransferase [Microthrixaceae bacterium]
MAGSRRTTRRHPSAGNVSARPALIGPDDSPASLPPCSFPHGDETGPPAVRLGPDLDNESLARLLGPLEGRRVLDLGCGSGGAAVAMARAGARVIAVDTSNARLTRARAAAELAEVHVEFHQAEAADLAFVRADSVDAVLAVYSLGTVADLPRVFRQLHRVLNTGAPLVISLAHPLSLMVDWDPEEGPTPWIARSFHGDAAVAWSVAGEESVTHLHHVSTVFTALQRSNFRVDTLLEPEPLVDAEESRSPHRSPIDAWVPPTLVVRARKEGN